MKILDVSQTHQKRVQEIVRWSLWLLGDMYHEEALRFCYAIKQDRAGKTVPSFRYTAIALLGLEQARRCGFPVAFPLDAMGADVALHAAAEEDLGNKALALWAALTLKSPAVDRALGALLAHRSLVTQAHEGLLRSTELAWLVYALALAWLDVETQGGGLLPRRLQERIRKRLQEGIHTLRALRNDWTGLFQCAGIPHGPGKWRDRLKTTSGLFDAQVYGAMALAQASQALDRAELLQEAYHTVLAVLRQQGKKGEWPWHYDVRHGTVIDAYPIFSVHQDGMGPMMLIEVGEALGIDFQEAVERSLAWVFGANELHIPMLDQDAGMVWRAQRRKGVLQYILQANRVAHHYRLPFIARVLRAAPGRAIEYECRPYHLGWALYVFCRPSQLIGQQADGK